MNAQAGLRLSVERWRRSWGGESGADNNKSDYRITDKRIRFRQTDRILGERFGFYANGSDLEAYGSDFT